MYLKFINKMELILDEKEQKIFQDGDKTYYMNDLGGYIGHHHRNWYDSVPNYWQLTKLVEICEDKEKCEIDALVNKDKKYLSIHIKKGNTRRIINMTDDNLVYSDCVINNNEIFYALDGDIYSENKVYLKDYLASEASFYGENGKTIENTLGNYLVQSFLTADQELKAVISNNRSR